MLLENIDTQSINHLRIENEIKSVALKFYLSDRFGYGIFNTLEYHKLKDIVVAILQLPYYDQYEIYNNRDYKMLDVYLNSHGYNEKHEQFTAHMKECDVIECFGGSGIYDVYGHGVCDMGKYCRIIAPYFYQHLGELKVMDNFDFLQDKRVLCLYSYYVGLH